MKELERILEEIDEMIKRYKENPRLEVVNICYGLNQAKNIIRKHLSRENGPEITSCSRDKDGWIPVEERLPEDDRYIFLSFENFSLPMIGRYEQDSDGSGNFYIGDETESCISQDLYVTAWRPMPKPYRPERSDNHDGE